MTTQWLQNGFVQPWVCFPGILLREFFLVSEDSNKRFVIFKEAFLHLTPIGMEEKPQKITRVGEDVEHGNPCALLVGL